MEITTYNDVKIPAFMYGTAWKKEATTGLVELAVEAGFKAIDTANQLIHYDEARVGEALLRLQERGVERESLFLQTKFTSVNGQDHRTPYDASADLTTQVQQSVASSLEHLHTDYLDSYVLHGPYSRVGITDSDREVWAAIEELYRKGTAKIIGVSNVSASQLDELCRGSNVKPMVVQNRCYASQGWDEGVRSICRRENIIYQGFSLLTANPGVLSHPQVRAIATRLSATPAQVVFRFSLDVGMLPLTGTTSKEHMQQDLQALDLELTPEEVRAIESIAVRV